MVLKDKRILLGVCGGIAVYKSTMLARAMIKAGALVQVVMTDAATKFVGPLTFEALTERACLTDENLFHTGGGVSHVEVARNADLIVIAPATATTIARLAGGFADNMLSASVLASKAPILLVPAMHTAMWESVPVQRNLTLLNPQQYRILPPAAGDLASGDVGPGRFPEVEDIFDAVCAVASPQDLAGWRIAVTAGPTREPMDPVRFISNPSTGKMGIEIARAAQIRGAVVDLVLGPTHLNPPSELATGSMNVRKVLTTKDMLDSTKAALAGADALIMAAAPSDDRPAQVHEHKLHKADLPKTLQMEANPDILKTLRPDFDKKVIVGFAAETTSVLESGQQKLVDKGLDLLFANPVDNGQGFGAAANQGYLLSKDGALVVVESQSKFDVANLILDQVLKIGKRK